MTKERKIILAGHVAHMGGRKIHTVFWWESQNETDHYGDLDIGGMNILTWILEK
jgi:hypothetical protein